MAKFHFFTDHSLLNTQTNTQSFGKKTNAGGKERFQVTSQHTAPSDAPAYAVCSGVVCVQKVNASLVNIILKPEVQPPFHFHHIKYFVYKGIKKSSLVTGSGKVESTGTDLGDNVDTDFKALHTGQTTTPASVLGYDLDASHTKTLSTVNYQSFLDIDPIEHLFHRSDLLQLPIVKPGEVLGLFNKNKIGFEIIIERSGQFVSLGSVREERTFIKVNPEAPSSYNDPDYFAHKFKKEQILSYVDPCALFGRFVHDGLFIKSVGGSSSLEKRKDNFYSSIINNFFNKNKLYIDVRNERNEYYNRYGNFQDDQLYLSNDDVSYSGAPYNTDTWPLMVVDMSTFSGTEFFLKLPIFHKYIARYSVLKRVKERHLSMEVLSLKSGDSQSPPMTFQIENTTTGAPIPSYIQMNMGPVKALEVEGTIISPIDPYENDLQPVPEEDFDQLFNLTEFDNTMHSMGIHGEMPVPLKVGANDKDLYLKIIRQDKFVAANHFSLTKNDFYYTGLAVEIDSISSGPNTVNNVSFLALPTGYLDSDWTDISTERPFMHSEKRKNTPHLMEYLRKYHRLIYVKKEQPVAINQLQSLHFLNIQQSNELNSDEYFEKNRKKVLKKKLDFYVLSIAWPEYKRLIDLKADMIANRDYIEDYGFYFTFEEIIYDDPDAQLQTFKIGLSGIQLVAGTLIRGREFPLLPTDEVHVNQNKKRNDYWNNQSFLISQSALDNITGSVLSSVKTNVLNGRLRSEIFKFDTVCNGIALGEYEINLSNEDIFQDIRAIYNIKLALKIVLPDLISTLLGDERFYTGLHAVTTKFGTAIAATQLEIESDLDTIKRDVFLLSMDGSEMNDRDFTDFRHYITVFKQVYNRVYHNPSTVIPDIKITRAEIDSETNWHIDQDTILALDVELGVIHEYDVKRGKAIWSGTKRVSVGDFTVPNPWTTNEDYFSIETFTPYIGNANDRKNIFIVLKNLKFVKEGSGVKSHFERTFQHKSDKYFFNEPRLAIFSDQNSVYFINNDILHHLFFEFALHYFSCHSIDEEFFYNFTYYENRLQAFFTKHGAGITISTGQKITKAQSKKIYDELKINNQLSVWGHPIKPSVSFSFSAPTGYGSNESLHESIVAFFFNNLKVRRAVYAEPDPASTILGYVPFNDKLWMDSCDPNRWFKVKLYTGRPKPLEMDVKMPKWVEQNHLVWVQYYLENGETKYKPVTITGKDNLEYFSHHFVLHDQYGYMQEDDLFLKYPIPEPNATLYKIKPGEGTLAISYKYYKKGLNQTTETAIANSGIDKRYYANAILFANNVRGERTALNYRFNHKHGRLIVYPNGGLTGSAIPEGIQTVPASQDAPIYINPSVHNPFIQLFNAADVWIDSVTGATGTNQLNQFESIAGSNPTDWSATVLTNGDYLWIPSQPFADGLKDVASGSLTTVAIQNLIQIANTLWPVGAGFSIDFSAGATFGFPIALDGNYVMIITRVSNTVFKLVRRGTLKGGFDATAGFAAGFGMGNQSGRANDGEDSEDLGLGFNSTANIHAKIGVTLHSEYEFDLSTDGALASMFMAALSLDSIPYAGDKIISLVKYFTSYNIDPNQYLTRYILKPFFQAGFSFKDSAKIGLIKKKSQGSRSYNNYDEKASKLGKVSQPYYLKWVLKAFANGGAADFTLAGNVKVALDIDQNLQTNMHYITVSVQATATLTFPFFKTNLLENAFDQRRRSIRLGIPSAALDQFVANYSETASPNSLFAAMMRTSGATVSIVVGNGNLYYYNGAPAYDMELVFSGNLAADFIDDTVSSSIDGYFRGIDLNHRLVFLDLGTPIRKASVETKNPLNVMYLIYEIEKKLLKYESILDYKFNIRFVDKDDAGYSTVKGCLEDIYTILKGLKSTGTIPKYNDFKDLTTSTLDLAAMVKLFGLASNKTKSLWKDIERDEALRAKVKELLSYLVFSTDVVFSNYKGFKFSAKAQIYTARIEVNLKAGVHWQQTITDFKSKLENAVSAAQDAGAVKPNSLQLVKALSSYGENFVNLSNLK